MLPIRTRYASLLASPGVISSNFSNVLWRARRFLDLSPDVRQMIYEAALIIEPAQNLQYGVRSPQIQSFNSAVAVPDQALVSVPRLGNVPPLTLTPQILRANRQIHEEASIVLYGRNYFRAEWVVRNPLSLFESKVLGIGHWVKQIGSSNAAKVKFLGYRLQYPEESDLILAVCNDFFVSVLSSAANFKGLQCLAIAGSLREFHLNDLVDEKLRNALFQHPLLKSLLRVDFCVRPLISCECTTPETRLRFLSEDRRWSERSLSDSFKEFLESERGLYEPGAYEIVAGSYRMEEIRLQH
ncbi:MAG: hypothetical protein Q9160_004156 [Pyrenula sp. 1 TL-2023]